MLEDSKRSSTGYLLGGDRVIIRPARAVLAL